MSYKINDLVTYSGNNRPYLKGMSGVVTAIGNNASMVRFTNGINTYSEWVGNNALDPVRPTPAPKVLVDSYKTLVLEKERVDAEYADLKAKLDKVAAQRTALANVLFHLKPVSEEV